MSHLNRLLWTAVFALAVSASASAQQQGGGGAGGGGAGGGGTGGGGGAGGGFGGGTQGGGGMGSQSGQGTSQPSSQFNLTQLEAAPTISAPGTSGGGGSGGGVVDTSNWLGPTYGNPYYQGIPANALSGSAPGGFGSPLYGTSGGTRGGSIGSAAGGTTGGRGGVGGAGGRGGIGGANTNATSFGTIIAPPIQISFSAVAKFKAPAVVATQLQTDIARMISLSTELSNPSGVQVIAQGSTVTLRGAVKDQEEARTLVGMVKLTPGVHRVTNELAFPRQ